MGSQTTFGGAPTPVFINWINLLPEFLDLTGCFFNARPALGQAKGKMDQVPLDWFGWVLWGVCAPVPFKAGSKWGVLLPFEAAYFFRFGLQANPQETLIFGNPPPPAVNCFTNILFVLVNNYFLLLSSLLGVYMSILYIHIYILYIYIYGYHIYVYI